MNFKKQSLTPEISRITLNKGTEPPFTGKYTDTTAPGSYLCRQCGLALFEANTKFHSGCGWPSFDSAVSGSVKAIADQDGRRMEILCERCGAHLGHVFEGENFTPKNTRYCVNSRSLDFIPNEKIKDTEEAIFAAGCFWGVEYYLKKIPGVLKTEVGYTGGKASNPSYEEICRGNTGHFEAVRVVYDPEKISYEKILNIFFELHDPTQANGQGPDIGQQYQSAIFYYNDKQKKAAESLISTLSKPHFVIKTKLLPVTLFWSAENYHQNYCEKNGILPTCHAPPKSLSE